MAYVKFIFLKRLMIYYFQGMTTYKKEIFKGSPAISLVKNKCNCMGVQPDDPLPPHSIDSQTVS